MAAGLLELDGYSDVVLVDAGGLGDIYTATKTSTGITVAIKALRDISDQSVSWQRARRELQAMASLKGHPYVIQIDEITEHEGNPLLVMEYAPGGSIDTLLHEHGRLSIGETVLIGSHIANALTAAHQLGVIHRDIKPHNVLIGAFGQAKVCDFGIAAIAWSDQFRHRTNALSYRYASPEELDGDPNLTQATDVYSLGATLAHCLQGRPPRFSDRDDTGQRLKLDWAPPGDLDPAISQQLEQLIHQCLATSPANRPTAHSIERQLDAIDQQLGRHRTRTLTPLTPATTGETESPQATDPAPPTQPDTVTNNHTHQRATPPESGTLPRSRIETATETAAPGPTELEALGQTTVRPTTSVEIPETITQDSGNSTVDQPSTQKTKRTLASFGMRNALGLIAVLLAVLATTLFVTLIDANDPGSGVASPSNPESASAEADSYELNLAWDFSEGATEPGIGECFNDGLPEMREVVSPILVECDKPHRFQSIAAVPSELGGLLSTLDFCWDLLDDLGSEVVDAALEVYPEGERTQCVVRHRDYALWTGDLTDRNSRLDLPALD